MIANLQDIIDTLDDRKIGKSPHQGCESIFVAINDIVGIKLYSSERTRDHCYHRQNNAAKFGLGPKTHGIIDLANDYWAYGYLTDIVECTGDDNDDFRDDLDISYGTFCEMVEQLSEDLDHLCNFCFFDHHEGNCGLIEGRLVCIDFG